MAVARSIFTLEGGFQLFCAAFDMPMTGVTLEVALGYKKIVFWAFQKNNHMSHLKINWVFLAFSANKEWPGEIIFLTKNEGTH